MISEIKAVIKDFISGNYDALAFSYDLPDMIVDNYTILESESPVIAKELDDSFTEICAEYEAGKPIGPFKAKIEAEYMRIFY